MIETLENAEDVHAELEDRFGKVPTVTENLLMVALIKAAAHKRYITEISGGKGDYRIMMLPTAKIDTYKMHGFLSQNMQTIKFAHDKKKNPYFIYRPKGNCRTPKQERDALNSFFEKLDGIITGNDGKTEDK